MSKTNIYVIQHILGQLAKLVTNNRINRQKPKLLQYKMKNI